MGKCGRRILLGGALCVTLVLSIARDGAAAPSDPPRITARSAIVLDGVNGQVLWERDAEQPLPPASTTKILTTVLALESGRLDRSFTVSPLAASQSPSKLGLRPGQHVQLEDLTYSLMLKSANDSAVVVAEGLAGSVGLFADLMNDRAREIGATNSHFHNPNGLPDDEHLTTTHDMARILRHALTVPGFREIAGTTTKVIQVEDRKIHPMVVQSKNRLLNGYFVPVLGKTGYTRAAGRCFAGAAELNGRRVITVVFGSNDMWGDTRRLMEYGFLSFEDTAPAVQVALDQASRSQRSQVARASSRNHRARATVVASKGRSAKPASSHRATRGSRGKSALRTSALRAAPTQLASRSRVMSRPVPAEVREARLESSGGTQTRH